MTWTTGEAPLDGCQRPSFHLQVSKAQHHIETPVLEPSFSSLSPRLCQPNAKPIFVKTHEPRHQNACSLVLSTQHAHPEPRMQFSSTTTPNHGPFSRTLRDAKNCRSKPQLSRSQSFELARASSTSPISSPTDSLNAVLLVGLPATFYLALYCPSSIATPSTLW